LRIRFDLNYTGVQKEKNKTQSEDSVFDVSATVFSLPVLLFSVSFEYKRVDPTANGIFGSLLVFSQQKDF